MSIQNVWMRLFLWFSNIVKIGWIYLMKEGIYHACNDHQHKEENPGRDYYLTLLLDKSWWTLLPSGEISESNWKMCCKRARSALTTDSVMRSLRPWCAKEMKGLFSSFCARRKRQLVATNKCFYTITEHRSSVHSGSSCQHKYHHNMPGLLHKSKESSSASSKVQWNIDVTLHLLCPL